ncbi:MAG: response regulator [Deltaproteobacteria bacterium]|nr:response regulator [Deltaproteobacteria bacterium]MCB9787885.1 response regulator [Deltaproteobacteria bacterium]
MALTRPVILCVDDEPLVLASLKEQLRRQFDGQFEVEVAQDSAEALEILGELELHGRELPVILSDHIMPGMKGDELLVEVHRQQPRTRKILLTGQAGVDAVGRVVNLAALYRYIAKPWDLTDLELTVREAVSSYYQELRVEQQHEELVAAHLASRRFVPFEFLHLLGRERLEEVSLNDHVEQELSVLFSDIRSYTTLAEGRGPKQTFRFINEYLSYMEPPIREERGFIDSFAGDGIMALFEGDPDSAVRAGIESLRALDRFNAALAARGEQPIRIGVGINTGPLMLGIIGGRDRLDAGVIGDPVNVAARIEAYTVQVGATLLISETTVAGLRDPGAFALRMVDRVSLKGRTQPVAIYEVLDALPEAERARKLATREHLEAGRDAMAEGRIAEASGHLSAAWNIDPDDPVVVRCLQRCRSLAAGAAPGDWLGPARGVAE